MKIHTIDEWVNMLQKALELAGDYRNLEGSHIVMSKKIYDDFNNTGSGRPDKKNSLSDYPDQNEKAMRKDVAKDIRTEGEREGKNIIDDDRANS